MIGNIPVESKWEALRCGKFTASQIGRLFTEPKSIKDKEAGKLSKDAMSYIMQKCSEIVTGTTRQVQNWSLDWGNHYEPEAAAYLYHSFDDFVYLGKESPQFFTYTDFSGGSPDGYSCGGLLVHEIKCPENPSNHIAYCMLEDGEGLKSLEKDYYYQVQMNMACVAKHFGHKFEDMRGMLTSYSPIVRKGYKEVHHIDIAPDMEFYERLPYVIERAEKKLGELLSKMAV